MKYKSQQHTTLLFLPHTSTVHVTTITIKVPYSVTYRVSKKKSVQRKRLLSFDENKKVIAAWNMYQCHKWRLGFWIPFISANLDAAIQRLQHPNWLFSKRSQDTNCATFHWMGQSTTIKAINVVVSFVSHSAKSGNWYLDLFWENSNISRLQHLNWLK